MIVKIEELMEQKNNIIRNKYSKANALKAFSILFDEWKIERLDWGLEDV